MTTTSLKWGAETVVNKQREKESKHLEKAWSFLYSDQLRVENFAATWSKSLSWHVS